MGMPEAVPHMPLLCPPLDRPWLWADPTILRPRSYQHFNNQRINRSCLFHSSKAPIRRPDLVNMKLPSQDKELLLQESHLLTSHHTQL